MDTAIEQIGLLCSNIENEILIYGDYVSDNLMKNTCDLLIFIDTAPIEIKKAVEEKIHSIILYSRKYAKVWLYSAMLAVNDNPAVLEEFLEYVISEKEFGPNVKYFLFYQARVEAFCRCALDNEKNKYLLWELLKEVVDAFKSELKDVLTPIPYEQRNADIAFVITEQILGESHGPTKTAFDRCKCLMETMHKKVLLINTAEVESLIGAIPLYRSAHSHYLRELLDKESLMWKGTEISYVQCENNMPNMAALQALLQMVQSVKPGLVVSIGGSSILGNLINSMIPVLTVGLLPSDLEPTMNSCQTLSRALQESDIRLLKLIGKDEGSIIQSVFTSSLKPQRMTVNRKEIGLQEDKFVIVVVGSRLDTEIDEHFMRMLTCALDDDMEVAFIGKFELFEHYLQKMPELRKKVHYLGLTDDILAWLEVCDLYVNPHRKGGGTSAVEALFKGIPVVTTAYGDVAVNVGEEFCTESYDTMPALIRKYKNDKDFYQAMSVQAKKKAEILLDTEGEFQRIIEEFENRTRD